MIDQLSFLSGEKEMVSYYVKQFIWVRNAMAV